MTVRHVARSIGSTGTTAPAYRVEMRVRSHELVADEPIDAGGGDLGPTPFGLLASALVACTAITLRMYAVRKDWELISIEIDVRYRLDEDDALTIERIVTCHSTLHTNVASASPTSRSGPRSRASSGGVTPTEVDAPTP